MANIRKFKVAPENKRYKIRLHEYADGDACVVLKIGKNQFFLDKQSLTVAKGKAAMLDQTLESLLYEYEILLKKRLKH